MLDYWFWRNAAAHEIDSFWQNSEKLKLVEIKSRATIQPDMFRGLRYFEKYHPDLTKIKYLVHTGPYNQK